jgi:RimJ/RimL family protein N-acetyltransferase
VRERVENALQRELNCTQSISLPSPISMLILNSSLKDVTNIFRLYNLATEYQKSKSNYHWQPFDAQLIETEIKEHRHWKIVKDDTIVCIFSTSTDDSLIWGKKDNESSLYLHRIATDPDYRGNNYVPFILEWVKTKAKRTGIRSIRLDTFSENQKLIDYYLRCGFTLLRVVTIKKSKHLPKHYQNASLGLFEIRISE